MRNPYHLIHFLTNQKLINVTLREIRILDNLIIWSFCAFDRFCPTELDNSVEDYNSSRVGVVCRGCPQI